MLDMATTAACGVISAFATRKVHPKAMQGAVEMSTPVTRKQVHEAGGSATASAPASRARRHHRRGLSLEYRSATSAAQTAAADWYIEPSMRAYLRAHASRAEL
jgi:hypothetical protein